MGLVLYLSTSGSDANGGSSETVIASGSGAATDGSSLVDLSADSPDLSAVRDHVDTIRIADEIRGHHGTDVFTIVAHDNNAKTVTVSGDANPGTSAGLDWCVGGAWASLQKAMEFVSAGDHVFVKADGAYTGDEDGDGSCAMIRRNASATAPIVFEGYREVPGDAESFLADHPSLKPEDVAFDTYRAVIDGSAAGLTNGIGDDSSLFGGLYYVFKHISVINCSGPAVMFDHGGEIIFNNCRASASIVGFYAGQGECVLVSCLADQNFTHGLAGRLTAIGCDLIDNSSAGLYTIGACSLMFSRVIGNGTAGVSAALSAARHLIANNTLCGNNRASGSVGIDLFEPHGSIVMNNVIHDFDIGLRAAQAGNDAGLVRNNLFAGNNTDRQNVPAGAGDVLAEAPGFVDASGGDYRLRYESPARGAGWPVYLDIGADQRRGNATHGPVNLGVQL